jgi:hypothetical protein
LLAGNWKACWWCSGLMKDVVMLIADVVVVGGGGGAEEYMVC